MVSKLSKSELDKIREQLPHGSIGIIAAQIHLSRVAVSNVFSGRFYNQSVIDAALELITQSKEAQKKLAAHINTVLA